MHFILLLSVYQLCARFVLWFYEIALRMNRVAINYWLCLLRWFYKWAKVWHWLDNQQDSKMPIQFMNSTTNPLRSTLIKVSSVSRLSLVLLSLLTQDYFEKPHSQTTVLVGITSMACHSDIRGGQLIVNSQSLPQKNSSFMHTSVFTNKSKFPRILAILHCID